MIIPFFIIHAGCPHQCVFCNQVHIVGADRSIVASSIPDKIELFLKTNAGKEPAQVAFYGGTFTALPVHIQQEYLDVVGPFIVSGRIKSIRLSTRPDCINHEILAFLKESHVQTIELGVQSMDDGVLALAMRGHTAADTLNAVNLIKEHGFTIGLQLMIGLPGDSADTFMDTVCTAIRLRPDFIRLYPLLVLKDTPLEVLYKTKQYHPLPIDEAVFLCSQALSLFEQAKIEVTRIGLQPTREMEKPGTILAGPYHPAFRQLVESLLLLDKMRLALHNRKDKTSTAIFMVNPHDLSAAVGQHRVNIEKLKKEFGLRSLRVKQQNHSIKEQEPVLLSNSQHETCCL
jgi:histone acetyltransferase (RNA polymerase elongator complex component)